MRVKSKTSLTQNILYNEGMLRKLRLVLAVLILVVSFSLLIWASWPLLSESRVVPIPPADLQLPTPSAFQPIFRMF